MIMLKIKAYKKKKLTMDNNFKLWKGNLSSERTTWDFANRDLF